MYSFICGLMLHVASWLLAVVMLETSILVGRGPMATKDLCTAERSKNVILVTLLFLICWNAHYFWTYGLVRPHGGKANPFCSFTAHGTYYNEVFRKDIWPVMDTMAAPVVPNLIVLSCLIFNVYHRVKVTPARTALGQGHLNASDRELVRNFSTVCIVLGVCGMLFTLPEGAYNMYEISLERRGDSVDEMQSDWSHFARRELARSVTYSLRYIFLSFKILLYFTLFRSFRKRALSVVTCVRLRLLIQKREDRYAQERKLNLTSETAALRNRLSASRPKEGSPSCKNESNLLCAS